MTRAVVTCWVVLQWMIAAGLFVDATCTEDQQSICRKSVSGTALLPLTGAAGECTVKQYVYFSHVCTVQNYLPNIDHCCCLVNDDVTTNLMCCRYHQGWNYFRCSENDDIVETVETSTNNRSLEVILPAVFVPLTIIVVCLLFCWVSKCGRTTRASGGENRTYSSNDEDRNKPSSSTRFCYRCYDELCGYDITDDCQVEGFQGPPRADGVEHERRHLREVSDKKSSSPTAAATVDDHRMMIHYCSNSSHGHGNVYCLSCRPSAPPYCSPVFNEIDCLPTAGVNLNPSAPPASTPTSSPKQQNAGYDVDVSSKEDGKPEVVRSTGSCCHRNHSAVIHPYRPPTVSITSDLLFDQSHCQRCHADGVAPPAYEECVQRVRTGSSYGCSCKTSRC